VLAPTGASYTVSPGSWPEFSLPSISGVLVMAEPSPGEQIDRIYAPQLADTEIPRAICNGGTGRDLAPEASRTMTAAVSKLRDCPDGAVAWRVTAEGVLLRPDGAVQWPYG
jgi:hypothetical protein